MNLETRFAYFKKRCGTSYLMPCIIVTIISLIILSSITFVSCRQGDNRLIAERWHIIGLRFVDVNQHELAVKPFTNAIEADPEYYAAWYQRGRAYCAIGQCELAIPDFTMAIELIPVYAVTYHDRGIAYSETVQYDLAILDFTQAIEIDPNSIISYLARGLAYKEQGMKTAALADFEKFLASTDNPDLIEVTKIAIEELTQ